ncbi:uncharacterized protein LOC134216710 [Armigeres subalbatus]|uniref:uncharacterized protein LOC134216710 n=1 Tax=Armigeres subalbatus TaxID=124917 RepID=UPI002ED17207
MAGRYVRVPLQPNPEEDVAIQSRSKSARYVRVPYCPSSENTESANAESEMSNLNAKQTNQSAGHASKKVTEATCKVQPPGGPNDHRLEVLEKAVVDLAQIMVEKERLNNKPPAIDTNWGYVGDDAIENGNSQAGGITIRLDQLPSFPKDVPSNRLWEEWRKYLENYEIAASLHQIIEPNKLAKVLFLAVGEDLQRIIRAARLRPNLEGPNCYNVFVKNVDDHLRSMTDTTTEHESFLAMRQEVGESAVTFHARLVDRARLCDYGRGDEERFVRSQLIKGMRDQEIAKAARLFNYESNFIVQAATRSEACEPVKTPSTETVLAIDNRTNPLRSSGKRTFQMRFDQPSRGRNTRFRGADDRTSTNTRGRQVNKQRGFGRGKRSKCSRCSRWAHETPQMCPALKSQCFECGTVGHFASMCRKKGGNHTGSLDRKREDSSTLDQV